MSQRASPRYKISWRFTIVGLYAIRLGDMPAFLRECGREGDEELWDKSLYISKRVRHLLCLGLQ